jgi:hypothetical protein
MTTRRMMVPIPSRPPSRVTTNLMDPTLGYVDGPYGSVPPGSLVSGQNCWRVNTEAQCRWGLSPLGATNPIGGQPIGAFLYDDLNGTEYPVIGSRDTVAYLEGSEWVPLTYVSGTSDLPMSGGVNDPLFGSSVYLESSDLNLAVFTNGVNPLFAWGGPSSGTGYSTLTQAPICSDVVLYDNSPVALNIEQLSAGTRYVQRVQWSVAGNPYDWTGIGSGFEDLLDMRGQGTRMFVDGDDLVVFSAREVWVGRKRGAGDPYRFQFDPLNRQVGLPYPRAAKQTPFGIFWFSDDLMVYRYQNRAIEPVGMAIQDTLRRETINANVVFVGYNAQLRHLTLYYDVLGATSASRAFTYDIQSGTWWPQRFTAGLVYGTFESPPYTASSTTVWGSLSGTFDDQTITWAGQASGTYGGFPLPGVLSSVGTAYQFSASAYSDSGSAIANHLEMPLPYLLDRRVQVDHIRLRLRADSASSMTVGFSPDAGLTYQNSQRIAISAISQPTEQRVFATVDGPQPWVRLQSTNGAWKLGSVFVREQATSDVL